MGRDAGTAGSRGGDTTIGSLVTLQGGNGSNGVGVGVDSQAHSSATPSPPQPQWPDSLGKWNAYKNYGAGGGSYSSGYVNIYGNVGAGAHGAGIYDTKYRVTPKSEILITIGMGGVGGYPIGSEVFGQHIGNNGTNGIVIIEY